MLLRSKGLWIIADLLIVYIALSIVYLFFYSKHNKGEIDKIFKYIEYYTKTEFIILFSIIIFIFLLFTLIKKASAKHKIKRCFANHDIKLKVKSHVVGSQIKRFNIKANPTTKFSQIKALEEDLKLALGAKTIPYIQAGNFGFITIDVPKKIKPALWKDAKQNTDIVSFPIGINIDGVQVDADFSDSNQCHMLVAGASGSGKSELLKSIVASLVCNNNPDFLKLVIVDPKFVTFSAIKKNPTNFMLSPIITQLDDAISTLERLVEEMDRRYDLLDQEGYEHLKERFEAGKTDVPYLVIIFDEFADLILAGNKQRKIFEDLVSRIAGKGRAAGIHLILATQRPSAKIVTGIIKANLPMKVCLKVTTGKNSEVVLDQRGADKLLGKGDLLCDQGREIERLQSYFISKQELAEILKQAPDGSITGNKEILEEQLKLKPINKNELLNMLTDLEQVEGLIENEHYTLKNNELNLWLAGAFPIIQNHFGKKSLKITEKKFKDLIKPIISRPPKAVRLGKGKPKWCYVLSVESKE